MTVSSSIIDNNPNISELPAAAQTFLDSFGDDGGDAEVSPREPGQSGDSGNDIVTPDEDGQIPSGGDGVDWAAIGQNQGNPVTPPDDVEGVLSQGDAQLNIDGAGRGSDQPLDVIGGGADDSVTTGESDDTVVSGGGNDTASGGGGNDTLEGGSGRDTLSGGDGDDVIMGESSDGGADSQAITRDAVFDDDSQDVRTQIATIYVAYFGRAPDPEGLDFWVDEFQQGQSEGKSETQIFEDISESFRLSEEAQSLFPLLDPDNGVDPSSLEGRQEVANFVNDVFQNLFNRDAEGTIFDTETGLGFWTQEILNRLDEGVNIGDIIVDIVSGAQNSDTTQDITTIENKAAVAESYAQAFSDTTDAEWTVADDIQGARDVVAEVDDAEDAVATGSAMAEQIAGDDGADVLEGGAGDDTLDGGSGNDTLTGGAGADTFQFGDNSDNDAITDFTPGEDTIDASNVSAVDSAESLVQSIEDDGSGNAVITFSDGNSVTLEGVAPDEVDTDDFNVS